MFDNELSRADLNTVRAQTSYGDNEVSERRAVWRAIKRNAKSPEELKMYMDMLGIRLDWLKEDAHEEEYVPPARRAVPRGLF